MQIIQSPAIKEQRALDTSLMFYNLKKVDLQNKNFEKIESTKMAFQNPQTDFK